VKIITALCLVFSLVISCETNDVLPNLGCMDVNSCNYSEVASADDGTCFYADECIDCGGIVSDSDGDGIGDCYEVDGCTDSLACNFNSFVTNNDGSCVFAIQGYDCDGNFGLIINEVLYDPPAESLGDANTDGTRDANNDEFIELVNISSSQLDLSGYMFFDLDDLGNTPAHIVPENTVLLPGKAFLLFGGGDENNFISEFGGSLVQVCSNKPINLNNGGDLLTIKDSQGEILITFDVDPLSDNPDESYTRSPDLTGEFVQHSFASEELLFSPGTQTNGNPF
jgi:hypothetical protein